MKLLFSILMFLLLDVTEVFSTTPLETEPTTKILSSASKLNEDYTSSEGCKEIALHKEETPTKAGFIRQTATLAAQGLLNITLFTTKVTAGTFAVYYLSQAANLMASSTAYTLIMYYSQNVVIANMVYVFGVSTCLPITSAVIFYLGYHSPEIIYYSGTTVIKVVQYTGKNVIKLTGSLKQAGKMVAEYLSKKENNSELIELVKLNQPESTTNMIEGKP